MKSELIPRRIRRSSHKCFPFTVFSGDAGLEDAAWTTYSLETCKSCRSYHLMCYRSRGEVEFCLRKSVETQCRDWAFYNTCTRREVELPFCQGAVIDRNT